MKMKKFAIIGFGLSGNFYFCQLVDKLISENINDCTILVLEKSSSLFGCGIAYDTNLPDIWTLNTSARKFQITHSGINLAQWISEHKNLRLNNFQNINEDYPPRAIAGLYLLDQYHLYKEKAIKHNIIVNEHIIEIKDITIDNENYILKGSSNFSVTATHVAVCIGHLPSTQFKYLATSPNYFPPFCHVEHFQKIPKNSAVHILGGQSSFIDIAVWLGFKHKLQAKIYSISRHATIITTKGNNDVFDICAINNFTNELKAVDSLTIASAQTLFWNTYKKSAKDPVDPRHLPTTQQALNYQLKKYDGQPINSDFGNIDELRSFAFSFYIEGCYEAMWNKLGEEDKMEFNKFFFSQLFAFVTGSTPVNARLLLELYERKQIIEKSGLERVEYDPVMAKFILYFKDGLIERAEYLIDATGINYDIGKVYDNKLIENLLAKGYLSKQPFGGIRVNADYTVISSSDKNIKNFYCFCPIATYGQRPSPYASFIAMNSIKKALDCMAISKEENCSIGNVKKSSYC